VTDFDPSIEPETQDQADAYVRWCAAHFDASSSPTTRRCAPTAPASAAPPGCSSSRSRRLHLHDDVDQYREIMMTNLAGHMKVARRTERQDPESLTVRDLIICRSVLDCWTPQGDFAMNLLDAAKCACAALVLQYVHPLEDLWDVDAPDVWSLILMGGQKLADINDALRRARRRARATTTTPWSRTVSVIDKMNWQKVNQIARHHRRAAHVPQLGR
jgi:hypothetical protein